MDANSSPLELEVVRHQLDALVAARFLAGSLDPASEATFERLARRECELLGRPFNRGSRRASPRPERENAGLAPGSGPVPPG
jgi:hypothetical protein